MSIILSARIASLEAALADVRRDRDALQERAEKAEAALGRIKENAEAWHGSDPNRDSNVHYGQRQALSVIAEWAADALAAPGKNLSPLGESAGAPQDREGQLVACDGKSAAATAPVAPPGESAGESKPQSQFPRPTMEEIGRSGVPFVPPAGESKP